jgi:L-ascorbate metabolism protein UlaG (beta-lactamase superfamily)
MELRWWGAAGFQVQAGESVFLIDPFLARNPHLITC